MAPHFFVWCSIFAICFAFSCESLQNLQNGRPMYKLEEAKLKIDQLESVLEAKIRNEIAKTLSIEVLEKDIRNTENQIQNLQNLLSDAKGDSPSLDARIRELEKDVKLMWAASRKNNFDLHVLEEKAIDAEYRVEVIASEVQEMSEAVTEGWIQIQHLEQMKEFSARRRHRPTSCTFLKLKDQALQQLKSFWALLTKYHHELQGLIKHEMEKTEFTAALANSEVVFFMASAMITFPVLGAWMFLIS